MSTDAAKLAIVTVTYEPDLDVLRAQQQSLPSSAQKILVDNASSARAQPGIRALAEAPATRLIANSENRGLATALNQGIDAARTLGCEMVLLLDQDTEPLAGAIEQLLTAYAALASRGVRVGAVGPRLVDAATGAEHGFHRIEGWRWVRRFPSAQDEQPIPCINLNGSGTLFAMRTRDEIGGLEDALFIDHVDTEWSFRLISRGYALFGVPQAVLRHRMGESCRRLWILGWRTWPWRSPTRHRFLFRNAVRLMKRSYVPAVWKVWAVGKLMLTFGVHLVIDRRRFQQAGAMISGAVAGIRST